VLWLYAKISDQPPNTHLAFNAKCVFGTYWRSGLHYDKILTQNLKWKKQLKDFGEGSSWQKQIN